MDSLDRIRLGAACRSCLSDWSTTDMTDDIGPQRAAPSSVPRMMAQAVGAGRQLFDKYQLDIADIRKRCEYSIKNTPVGVHLGKCLDEIERLRNRVAELESHLATSIEMRDRKR